MTLVQVADIKGIDVSNLIFTEDVLKSFAPLNSKDLSKIVTILGTLNLHGLSFEHFRNRIERLSGKYKALYELKVKSLCRDTRLECPTMNNPKANCTLCIMHY